jgi:uncharacterized iron-regulated protein
VQAQSAADTASLDPSAFAVYTSDGTPAALGDVVAAADSVDVVFLGEQHNDPTAHALQATLFRRALARAADTAAARPVAPRPVALSMEMFTRDVQPVVNEYLDGWIEERHFVRAARAWSNYAEAYRPLLEAAKEAGRPVLAANAPRRYVSRVARQGAESLAELPASARQWLPPLPYPMPSPAYQAKWTTLMREAMPPGHGSTADAPPASDASAQDAPSPDTSFHGASHGSTPHGGNPSAETSVRSVAPMLQAQALWDATMGYTLAEYLMRTPGALALHLTGAFHMTRGTGTPEALRHYRPSARMLTVVLKPAADVTAFAPDAHAGLADFVILTDEARIPKRPSAPSME